jgi:PEP-CTERM motif-containing protein
MRTRCLAAVGAVVLALMLPTAAQAGPVLFEASGANAAAILATVDAFRTALGSPNNANQAGPLASGRREINWDGGGAAATANAPASFAGFQNTRGALFTTDGTGFLQAVLTNTLTDLGNATYATTFSTFSPARVFTPVASNVTDATFFVPGSLTPAGVSAFGAVFTDVDLFGPTMIELFGLGDVPLFSKSVLAGTTPNGSLSFLGARFDSGLITRVRITTGNTPLGPNDDPAGGVEVVAMDDFLYSEPQAVPEPSSLALLALGAVCAGVARRRKK